MKVSGGQCLICDEVGPLTRGWCRRHYMQWWRTSNPLKVRRKEHRFYKNIFSRAKWNSWLAELNRDNSRLADGIDHFRRLCAKQEPT